MNVFRFLKSTRGAIKPLNALIISGVAGAGFFFTVNTAANKQIAAQRAIRSVSHIAQTSPRAGMLRRGNLLTSINVRDGRNQLANAKERAAMQGNSALDKYVANQRALGSMDEALTRAAQFSDSDAGLNTGNRNAVQTPVELAVGNPRATRGDSAVSQASGEDGGGAGQSPARLANASLTRSSGHALNATAQTGGVAVEGGASRAEGSRLSGSMPSGSNIVSQRGLDGALAGGRNTASFGQDRKGRFTRGRNSKGDRDELKDIVKRSADAAGNANASANEGGRAFLANARNSGGVTVEGGEDMTRGASSEDLSAPTARKLKAVGDKLSDEEKKLEEMNQDNRRLRNLLIATVIGSIGMMILGARILPKLHGFWRVAVAVAMCAAVAAANTVLFIQAAKFADKYNSVGGTGLAKLAIILSPIMVAGMVFTAIKPTGWKGLGSKIWGSIKKGFEPVGLLTGQVTNSITGLFK